MYLCLDKYSPIPQSVPLSAFRPSVMIMFTEEVFKKEKIYHDLS